MTTEPTPRNTMSLSAALQAAITDELAVNGREPTPEEILDAAGRVYNQQGERPFDPMNDSDMLLRSMIIAEAME